MEPIEIVAVAVGLVIMVLVQVDVVLTVLHPDVEGPIAHQVQRTVWHVAVRLAVPKRRRRVLAMAGPAMLATTFVIWVVAFVWGYALVVWPFVDEPSYDAPEPDADPLVRALYVAGVTVTTLGYGDVVPTTSFMRLLAVVAGAAGFALLTGVMTYVIQLSSSLGDRFGLALRMHDDTGGTGDGVGLVVSSLADEELGDVWQRFHDLGDQVRQVHHRLHRLPEVGLYQRTTKSDYDPEPAFQAVLDATLALSLVVSDDRFRRLRPLVEGLQQTCRRLVADVGSQYVPRAVRDTLEQAEPEETDRVRVAALEDRLRREVGVVVPPDADRQEVLVLARQARVFLDGLDRLTRWRATA